MEAIINFIYAFDNLCWDYAFPVLLIGSGIFFTILFKGKYLFNIKQIVQNSIGYSLKKNSDGQGTVSAFNAGPIWAILSALATSLARPLLLPLAVPVRCSGCGSFLQSAP